MLVVTRINLTASRMPLRPLKKKRILANKCFLEKSTAKRAGGKATLE
jgi:hypothetical protein